VEALIPLIIQGVVLSTRGTSLRRPSPPARQARGCFHGQIGASKAIPRASPSWDWASQPHAFAANYTWRLIYFVASGLGFLARILLMGFLPETRRTRWGRTLASPRRVVTLATRDRPPSDFENYTRRTVWANTRPIPLRLPVERWRQVPVRRPARQLLACRGPQLQAASSSLPFLPKL